MEEYYQYNIYRVDFMSFQGKLCGLCGNYDGNIKNDFTTSNKLTVVEELDFGNSWKGSPTCPDAKPPKDSCNLYSHRYAWALKQCSILKSKVFASCHSKVGKLKLKPLQLQVFLILIKCAFFGKRWSWKGFMYPAWGIVVPAMPVETVIVSAQL